MAASASLGVAGSRLEAATIAHKTADSALEPMDGAALFVSPKGNDENPGTESKPLLTLSAAQRLVRRLRAGTPAQIAVYLRAGTYYLDSPIVFTPEDSGKPGAPTVYSSYPGETAVVSGGTRLTLDWTSYRDGIVQAKVPRGLDTDQLFVNGSRQILARYPNFDPNVTILNGWSPDAIGKERAKRWANPRGGYIHALHKYLWGGLDYEITGKDAAGELEYEGGWQHNQPQPMHEQYRYVENIFEELDAPGEWFLDRSQSRLYYYPPAGLDLAKAVVETVRLEELLRFEGSADRPVTGIQIRNLTFRHSRRTFMKTREPLLRSDWRIYRGGAVFLEGAEDCWIDECRFDQMGGNAIFFSNYNRNHRVSRCHIFAAGASGVCFVGDPKAVRSPLFDFETHRTLQQIDLAPGPLTANYPKDCRVENTLIHDIGAVEKQTAGVEISMADSITVSHCSIYRVPRAGINIGDGTWGGHCIEFCDVFDTVRETGDHGSFNSWGRDRWWGLKGVDLDTVVFDALRDLPRLDAIKPTTIRHSRWRCDHGWDIDLDDGSSNFNIYNNLCLNGGIKLREGFYRVCANNVTVNNTIHQHVWFNDSEDVLRNNIVFSPYRPIQMRTWTSEIDFNFLHTPGVAAASPATELQALSHRDRHSLRGDAMFQNPQKGDYCVRANSPALQIGFENFSMTCFGVESPALRAIALEPELPGSGAQPPATLNETRSRKTAEWRGATFRNVLGQGEVSAFGTPGETGLLVIQVQAGSPAEAAGLRVGDVVTKAGEKPIVELHDLVTWIESIAPGDAVSLTTLRQQRETAIRIPGVPN